MSYLKHKPGSIEELMANEASKLNDNAYQDMFKKELDKAGKGIGSMSPKEKKDFFNKIDDKYKAKNEEVSKVVPAGSHKMPDGTIMKDKDHKKEVKEEDAYDKDDEKPKSKPKKETHSFMTKDMNKSKKDAKGEKEIVDPEPKLKQESLQDAIKSVWQLSAEELEKMKSEAKYMKAQRMNQYKAEDEKNKKGTADTGSKATKVDVEPSVDYKN
jgi:hypothetical protein